jgi:uncharacterized protein
MSDQIVTANPATMELTAESEAFPPEWVLSGSPQARSQTLSRSRDWTSHIVVWECTAGKFKWHYSTDEVLLVISGEAFLLGEKGEERRFGPGDLAFFPAGTTCTWRVAEHIRKVAVLRETMWRPLGFGLKVLHKLFRIAGLSGKSPLMFM